MRKIRYVLCSPRRFSAVVIMYLVGTERNGKSPGKKDSLPRTVSHVEATGKENVKLTDAVLEYHDPTPDIHELFISFNEKFFWGRLGMVEVNWSNRMTTCAGLCRYEGKKGLCSIKLSAPLLLLRPRKDLIETLLHEMIHAFLFVTENYRDRTDHGPEFHKHMNRINELAGTKITVYHSFIDEVSYYQRHVWRCNGPCRSKKPFYGLVKRSMNRKPGPYDYWWQEHQKTCNGTFMKISEPDKNYLKFLKGEKDKGVKSRPTSSKDIRTFFPPASPSQKVILPTDSKEDLSKVSNTYTSKNINSPGKSSNTAGKSAYQPYVVPKSKVVEKVKPKVKVQEKKVNDVEQSEIRKTVGNAWTKKYPLTDEMTIELTVMPQNMRTEVIVGTGNKVSCPVCNLSYSESVIYEHIEECLMNEESEDEESTEEKSMSEDVVEVDESSDDSIQVVEHETPERAGNRDGPQCPISSKAVNEGALDRQLEVSEKHSFKNEELDKKDGVLSGRVTCPCCMKLVLEHTINNHIDECLTFIALKGSLRYD